MTDFLAFRIRDVYRQSLMFTARALCVSVITHEIRTVVLSDLVITTEVKILDHQPHVQYVLLKFADPIPVESLSAVFGKALEFPFNPQ